MNEKIFIDSDIILDVLMDRKPFYESSAELLALGITKKVYLFTTPVVLANVFYFIRKKYGIDEAKEQLRKLRLFINILSVEEKTVDMALNLEFNDFEDGLQYFAAKENDISILITRNTKHYKVTGIPIVETAEEYITAKEEER
jgi:predicted nucleic acid-binding protein